MNDTTYITTYYVDTVFHTYDAKQPTFTLSNLEKKPQNSFKIQHTNTLLHFQ